MFLAKNTKHIFKNHLILVKPPLTVKTMNCMRQTGPRVGA